MKESVKWGDIQEIETVGGLNRNITSGDVQETVLVQEAMQERRILLQIHYRRIQSGQILHHLIKIYFYQD